MILCEWDASEGDPGQSYIHLFARILSTSFTSVSIFSVCCYSSVSISVVPVLMFTMISSTDQFQHSALSRSQFQSSGLV
jgi:hypothetical protein